MVPATKEFVRHDFPTARKPRIAIFLWTTVGSGPLLIILYNEYYIFCCYLQGCLCFFVPTKAKKGVSMARSK